MKIYSKYSKIVGVVSSVAIWRKEHTHLSCVSEYHTGINRGERNIHIAKRQHEKLIWSAYPAIKTDSCWTDKKCSYLTGYEMEQYDRSMDPGETKIYHQVIEIITVV